MKWKELLKNKFVVGGAAAVLVVAVTITAVLLTNHSPSPPVPEPSPASSEISVQPPSVSTSSRENQTTSAEDKAPGDESTVSDVNVNLEEPVQSKNGGSNDGGRKAQTPNNPVTPAKPKQPDNPSNEGGGIQIGGGDAEQEKYNCGAANHHCENAEFHAALVNRELEGCKFCGSHACPSFYDVNEWGYTQWTPSKCPKYNAQNDPQTTCPKCGREMWSPDNPTGCFSFLQDTTCECGEFVEGNTCHHH